MTTKHVIFEVNERLKNKFKKACIDNDETQKEAMNRLVQYYVNTNGKLERK
jgi:hypothetical protein